MYLESPNEKGKFLSVDLLGNINFTEKDRSKDQVWNVIENTGKKIDGILLVSELYKMALNYDPERHGEQIHGKVFNGSFDGHTLWNFSDEDETLYTIDSQGDRRYLWSLTGDVYVTPDEHIAERWTPISLEGYDTGSTEAGVKKTDKEDLYLVIWFVLFVIVLYMLFLKR